MNDDTMDDDMVKMNNENDDIWCDDMMMKMMDAWNEDDEWWYDGWWDGEDEWWDDGEKMMHWYDGAICPYEPALNHQTMLLLQYMYQGLVFTYIYN